MSIISWTSPRASEVILPTSGLTSVARSRLCSRSSSPKRRTRPPRTGAGTVRQVRNASPARATARSTSVASCQPMEKIGSPLIGEVTGRSSAIASRSTPHRRRASSAWRLSLSALGRVTGWVLRPGISAGSTIHRTKDRWGPASVTAGPHERPCTLVRRTGRGHPRAGHDDRVQPLVLHVGPVLTEPRRQAVALELAEHAGLGDRVVRARREEGLEVLPHGVDAVGEHQQQPVRGPAFAVARVGELADGAGDTLRRLRGAEDGSEELVLD